MPEPEDNGAAAPVAAPVAAPASTASAPSGNGGVGNYTVRVNGKPYSVEVLPAGAAPQAASAPVAQATAQAPAPAVAPAPASGGGGQAITSPLPGSVFALKCKAGDTVNEGDTVLVLESMKMESEVHSPFSGRVESILVTEGANVQTGDELILIA